MTIGPDIEEAINEVGTAFTIIRDSGNVTGEYLFFKPNQQVTKPFIREFFLEAWFSYETGAVAGDIIEFNVTGNRYIVMNLTALVFENTSIKKDGVLYKTNITPTLYRMSHVRDPQTYQERTIWTAVKSDFDALLTTPLHGHDFDSDEQLGIIGLQNHELYLPASIDIQIHDQIRISSDEYYRVETIMKRRYDNVNVCGVGEDTRTWTTTTTTTTTSSSTTTTTA